MCKLSYVCFLDMLKTDTDFVVHLWENNLEHLNFFCDIKKI